LPLRYSTRTNVTDGHDDGNTAMYTLCPKKTVVPNFGDNFVTS